MDSCFFVVVVLNFKSSMESCFVYIRQCDSFLFKILHNFLQLYLVLQFGLVVLCRIHCIPLLNPNSHIISWQVWTLVAFMYLQSVHSLYFRDGTSIILSDDVGQLYILDSGQGESHNDAKYDQVDFPLLFV